MTSEQTYIVNGVAGFSLTEALKLFKARYEDYDDFYRNVILHPSMEEFGALVKDFWDEVSPITAAEALQIKNAEQRRAAFFCIGVTKLFKALDAEMMAREVVKKKNRRWDENNQERIEEIEDVYELYRVRQEKLFPENVVQRNNSPWQSQPQDAYAVRCWCTTTQREYFIFVPNWVAVHTQYDWKANKHTTVYDPIGAIAWTQVLNITDPVRIYRQGDVTIAEASEASEKCDPYHLTKKQYLDLMYAET